ncbi:MAG: DUF5107 domain-containing protein [Clostridia bacterium]|nr:DUF5107 domain-containing protein [Clostridia bacterium]
MRIKSETFEIRGSVPVDLNPLPKFKDRFPAKPDHSERFPAHLKESLGYQYRTLPYMVQDRYSRKRDLLKLKSFVLENKYLKARFLPQFGGKLHSLFDKINGEELLFSNPVIQPGNLGIRNAWLSGGVEWNIGNIGHTFTTCDNVFSAVLQDGEGNDFLRIYEFERQKSIFWQADFHLPDDSPYLIIHVRMVNPFDTDTTTYWWSNIACPDTGKTRVLSHGKYAFTFTDGACDYERLPKIDAFPGKDISYPSNGSRSFDYFIQYENENDCTWEAAAYENGLVFYERSTPPLYYKKLFAWGNHHAGKHWQEFLSDGEGTGYYVELQAGIAPSQLNDKILPAHGKYEWTQCFGGVKADPQRLFDGNFDKACDYFGEKLDELLSSEDITELDKKYSLLADTPIAHDDIKHNGSGFGALEILRMKKDNDAICPASLLFPENTIGNAEKIWLYVLENGKFPKTDKHQPPLSYMTSEKWDKHIKNALDADNCKNWFGLLQYGVSMYERYDHTVLANDYYDEKKEAEQTELARCYWKKSIELVPNIWAYRNLAKLEEEHNNYELTEKYYDCALELDGVYDDHALVSEYLAFLGNIKKYQKLWNIFNSLPANCKSNDRIRITAAIAAVKLDHLDYLNTFFSEEHYDIREGECTLTDVWFEFCARKIARERGIDVADVDKMQILLDEAWDKCPPDPAIDFRMSFDKTLKYRI